MAYGRISLNAEVSCRIEGLALEDEWDRVGRDVYLVVGFLYALFARAVSGV